MGEGIVLSPPFHTVRIMRSAEQLTHQWVTALPELSGAVLHGAMVSSQLINSFKHLPVSDGVLGIYLMRAVVNSCCFKCPVPSPVVLGFPRSSLSRACAFQPCCSRLCSVLDPVDRVGREKEGTCSIILYYIQSLTGPVTLDWIFTSFGELLILEVVVCFFAS